MTRRDKFQILMKTRKRVPGYVMHIRQWTFPMLVVARRWFLRAQDVVVRGDPTGLIRTGTNPAPE